MRSAVAYMLVPVRINVRLHATISAIYLLMLFRNELVRDAVSTQDSRTFSGFNKFLGVSWSIKRNDDQQKQVLFQGRPLTKRASLRRWCDWRTTRSLKRSRLNINCARLRMVKGMASGSTSGLSLQNIFQSGRWQERHVWATGLFGVNG